MENRKTRILDILKKSYPNAKIVLNYSNNWELLVSVILSAQCTDKKVNQVTAKLFEKYRSTQPSSRGPVRGRGDLTLRRPESAVGGRRIPGIKGISWRSLERLGTSRCSGLPRRPSKDSGLLAMTREEERREIGNFATTPIQELEKDITSTGFYHNKAKNIQGAAKMLLEKFDGKLPKTMTEMLKLPGVARKTANVVLGNAYGIVEGIAVDTHVLRLSQRLRLVPLDKIGGGKKPVWFTKYSEPRQYASHSRGLRPRVMESRLRGTGVPADFSPEKNQGPSVDYYKDASPEKIEQSLMKLIPKKDWFTLTYLLIDHGRALCKAQNPDCAHCPLNKICPVSRT